ncbi:hypothetical protein [Actinomycetospora atypica]|uniref:Uncharacterized protein n=1 Tax=Actinomycetospora atypica TaxID=1290095 RepID=A0ABV9YKR1_9PSEU
MVENFAMGGDGNIVGLLDPCGARYQEGPPPTSGSPVCSCRTYAIRSCTTCSAPLCGDHSEIYNRSWTCSRCVRILRKVDVQRSQQRRDAALAPYLALPPLDTATMRAYLDGRVDDIEDGVTHQIWNWSNGDVARIMRELLGDDLLLGCQYIGIYGGEELTQNGDRVMSEVDTSSDSWRPHYAAPSTEVVERAGPTERFNAPFIRDSEADGPQVVLDRLQLLRNAIAEQRKHGDYRRWAEAEESRRLLVKVCLIIALALVVFVLLVINAQS